MTTSKLRVQGLDGADEAAELRQTVGIRAGVRELSFDYLRDVMIVEHDESVASSARLVEAVASAGMRAEVWQDDALNMMAPIDDGRWLRTALMMASGCCLALAFVCDWWTLGWRGAFGVGESGHPPHTR